MIVSARLFRVILTCLLVILTLSLTSFGIQAVQDLNFSPKIVVWSPDGTMFAVGGSSTGCDETVANPDRLRIFDSSTGEVAFYVPDIGCGVLSLDWSPDSSQIVMSDMRAGIRIWDLSTGEFTPNIRMSHAIGILRPVNWNPAGSTIVVTRGDNRIILLDDLTGQRIGDVSINGLGGDDANWNWDGTRLLVSSDGRLINYDVTTEAEDNSIAFNSGWMRDINSSQDGLIIAVYGIFQMIRVIDGETWESISNIETGVLTDIDLSPDGSMVVGVGPLPGLTIWDTVTGEELMTMDQAGIYGAAWSPDGSQLIYVGDFDNEIVTLNLPIDDTENIDDSE